MRLAYRYAICQHFSVAFVLAATVGTRVLSAEPIAVTWGGTQCNPQFAAGCSWSDPNEWVPIGTVPADTLDTEYLVTVGSGTVVTDIPVEVSQLALLGGNLLLSQPLNVDAMTIAGGLVSGAGKLHVHGDLVLRGGLINNTAGSPDGLVVDGAVVKRGYGSATLSPFSSSGDYEIIIEQGTFGFGNGGAGSAVGGITVASPEFARLSTERSTSDRIYLNNARGFNGTGALTATSINGDVYLGDEGAVIESAGFGGAIHGGFLQVTRGASVTSANHTYSGATRIGVNGEAVLFSVNRGGQLLSTSAIDVGGHSTLAFSNQIQFVDNRIGDSIPIVLNGGTISAAYVAGTNVATEKVGNLVIPDGSATIEVPTQTSSLTFQKLERSGSATINFNLDTGIGTAFVGMQAMFDTAPSLSNSILGGWATTNTDFATYDAELGIMPLDIRVNRPVQINGSGPTDHVRVGLGGMSTLTADCTIATLNIPGDGHYNVNLGGHTLTLADEGLLRQAYSDAHSSISNGRLTAGDGTGPAELYLRAHVTVETSADPVVEVSADIVDNPLGGDVSLVKSGNVDVSLSGVNTYSGPTVVQKGRLYFSSEQSLPDDGDVIIEAAEAILEYEPTRIKHLAKLSLRQAASFVAPRDSPADRSLILVDADEYDLESGRMFVSLTGDGQIRKTTEGVAELRYDSPDFSGKIVIEAGTLVAGASTAAVTSTHALGTNETTIMPGGTLFHGALESGAGYMNLVANLHLAGGDVGVGRSSAASRWDFDGNWRVTAPSRLLMFDPLGDDNVVNPLVNVLGETSLDDNSGLTVLGPGSVHFTGGVVVSGDSFLEIPETLATLSSLSAGGAGGALHVTGQGILHLPLLLAESAATPLTLEIAAGVTATSDAVEATTVGDNVTLIVNGQLTNELPLTFEGGTLGGSGSLGDVNNLGGVVSPGQSMGVLTVGDYQQGVGGMSLFELRGGHSGISDQLVAESVVLGGIIWVVPELGNQILAGDAYDLIIADSIDASNATLHSNGFHGRLDVLTLMTGEHSGKQTLRLSIVPEASTAVLVALALLITSAGTRRRNS